MTTRLFDYLTPNNSPTSAYAIPRARWIDEVPKEIGFFSIPCKTACHRICLPQEKCFFKNPKKPLHKIYEWCINWPTQRPHARSACGWTTFFEGGSGMRGFEKSLAFIMDMQAFFAEKF